MSIITLHDLRKTFQTRRKPPGLMGSLKAIVKPELLTIEAVKGISFDLEPGELLAFIGPNGAGKSTTILLHRPEVIFLDEPTIGLDVVAKQQIRDTIKLLHEREGTTIFLTSHDASDIESLCKRVIVISKAPVHPRRHADPARFLSRLAEGRVAHLAIQLHDVCARAIVCPV
jgi:ABC-type uncharacterized transport system ATPase subunit